MTIITCGIILPNGRFLPNDGNGHRKNALKFCEQYPELKKMMESDTTLDPDEFLLVAGCAIIAAYRGEKCLKVAKNNHNLIIKNLAEQYAKAGFAIWPYWKINGDYKKLLDNIINCSKKMQLIKMEAQNETRIYYQ